MPPAPGSDPWAVSVRLGSDNRSWATTYGADRRAALGPPRSPSSAARTYTLGMLPPPTPRRDAVASVQLARLPTPPGSARPGTGISPAEAAFQRANQLSRPAEFTQVGRCGTVVRRDPGIVTGGLLSVPVVPQHGLDTPSYHPRRMCELTKFEETKNRTAHDYTAKMRDRRTNAGMTMDVRGIDQFYGRKSNATGFVESVFAAPYPTSFRSGAGFGFATSR